MWPGTPPCMTITAAGDMPNEPFGDEGSCSGCAEPERSGTKPAHLTPLTV